METDTIQLGSWLVPLITGILGLIIGYFLGMRSKGPAALLMQLEEIREQHTGLEIELAECRKHLQENGNSGLPEIPFDPRAARAAFGKRIQQNDLKLIEGIGPKIEGLFHNFDIKTWKALAETPVAKCQEVLDSGGDRYLVHDPASWPMQARMAYEGKWKALARWQEEHKHGKL